jgi:hypothetical protein
MDNGAYPREDPVLRIFARAITLPEQQVALTLSVGGTVITGLLVSRDRWWDHLAAHEGGKESGPLTILRDTLQQVELQDPEAAKSEEDFLHLCEVRVAARPLAASQLWRVRITEVAGWGIGSSIEEADAFAAARPRP